MADNQTVKERLIVFISYLGIGQGKFEKNCGLANAYVANIRKSITPEKLQKIAQRYPELNTGWLMTGEGDMLRKKSTPEVDSSRFTTAGAASGMPVQSAESNEAVVGAINQLSNALSAIKDLAEAMTLKDQQFIEMIRTKDSQLSEMISLLKKKDEYLSAMAEKTADSSLKNDVHPDEDASSAAAG